MVGHLTLIIGPMFSSKSSELIKYYRKYNVLGRKILCLNHATDIRYGDNIIATHDQNTLPCVATPNLLSVTESDIYTRADVILIDEGQFFEDLISFTLRAVYDDKKTVIISGLIGDYQKKIFGKMIELLPEADKVIHLTAYCMKCKDGTPGPFTKRLINDDNQTLVGSNEMYISVCRKHH